ncbi:MAG: hypothetical protein DI535_00210 [Citrobacter freundii]|nr:MAG: hypothetical protein DI535_00210 [Citrobacter freundii]
MLKTKIVYTLFFTGIASGMMHDVSAQDSSRVLQKVTLRAVKKRNLFLDLLPSQSLDQRTLQQVNAPTVGDAARFFSGVQVKDYGGIGGLKTISVRSLGASQTGVLYDGIPVSDVQTGQIDLSRYSSSFLQSIDLYQANMPGSLLPARAFSSASVLAMYTAAFYPQTMNRSWQGGLRQGSFGYWQAFAGKGLVLPRNWAMNIQADAISSKGDYPFTVVNGNIREDKKRGNGELRSIQGELNLLKTFNDSSGLQIKAWTYDSKRGLPGAVIFFNDRSVQKLYNRDYFIQTRYNRSLSSATSLLVNAKFNHAYTRYVNPDFQNGAGGLDDRYRQNEAYLSVAADHKISQYFTAALSADGAYTFLHANKNNFARPERFSQWSNALLNFSDSLWQVQSSVLFSWFSDQVSIGASAGDRSKLTPSFSISRKWKEGSPLSFRFFYKEVFRMPTFNDLYYNFIGNTNLRPEYARQYNAGVVWVKELRGKLKQFNLSVDGYVNRIKDKIVAVPSQNLFSWTMLNLGKVDIKGVDVTAQLQGVIGGAVSWFGRVSYTWQRATDITDPTSSRYKDRIPYTPDHSGSGILSFAFRQWSAGYSVTYSGTRYTLGENNPANQLDGWGTHDVFVARQLNIHATKLTVKAELNNLSDERFDIVRNYPMPGRSYKISLLFNHL